MAYDLGAGVAGPGRLGFGLFAGGLLLGLPVIGSLGHCLLLWGPPHFWQMWGEEQSAPFGHCPF